MITLRKSKQSRFHDLFIKLDQKGLSYASKAEASHTHKMFLIFLLPLSLMGDGAVLSGMIEIPPGCIASEVA